MNGIVHRASGAGKMKNVIYFPAVKRLIDVDFPKFKTSFVAKMVKIGLPAGQEVIHRNNGIAFRQQSVAEVRAQEPGPAGNQGAWLAHDGLSFVE